MSNKDVITRAIAETTKQLMRQKPVEKITVSEICSESGVNPRTFYRYFRDKYDVAAWIYNNSSLTLGRDVPGWTIWDYMPYIVEVLYNDRDFYRHAFQFRGQNSLRWHSLNLLHPILERDYAAAFPDKLSLDFFIEHICEMSFDSFVIWLSMEPCPEPERYLDYFVGAFRSVCGRSVELIGAERKRL